MSLPAAKLGVDWCVTASKAWHIDRMAPHVREADRAELWAGWHSTPEQSLRHGLARSSHCWTALINFQPVCMLGVVPQSLLGASGVVWLIGTDAVLERQIGFLRRCRPHLRRIQQTYAHLQNYVSVENTAAIGWLRWLGFSIADPAPFGPQGVPFHHFEWMR
jgi:hypothetical protein